MDYWYSILERLPMTRKLMMEIVLSLSSAMSPTDGFSAQNIEVITDIEYFGPFSTWTEHEIFRKYFVTYAPLEWLDYATDLAVKPPKMKRYHARIVQGWNYELPRLIGGWGYQNPEYWLEKMKALLCNRTGRLCALEAIAEYGRKDATHLLVPYIGLVEQLSEPEISSLIGAVGVCCRDRLQELKKGIPATFEELHQEIDDEIAGTAITYLQSLGFEFDSEGRII